MRRGLDGYLFLAGLVRFSSSTGAVSTSFGGEIARGKHLFPFRTEPLSLSAPMVLGGQPPGRVGRRRSSSRTARRGGPRSFRTLRREVLLGPRAVVQVVRGAGGEMQLPDLALAGGLGLDPVLPQSGEGDDEIGRAQQPLPDVYELACHGRQGMDATGRKTVVCRGTCKRADRPRSLPGSRLARRDMFPPPLTEREVPDAARRHQLRVLRLPAHHRRRRR